MTPFRRWNSVALVLAATVTAESTASAQEIEIGPDGTRYQVTRRVSQRQVPVTVMQDRHQTVYTQQVTTDSLTHQQLFTVPVTSYQWNSRLRGRWNPLVTPYWTHNLRPVTSWHTQVANVQIPVSRVSWVPQTKTVQVPVTAYRTAEEETVTRIAMDQPRTLAAAQPLSGTSATIAVRPSTGPIGGVQLQNDPLRQSSSWQSPSRSRY